MTGDEEEDKEANQETSEEAFKRRAFQKQQSPAAPSEPSGLPPEPGSILDRIDEHSGQPIFVNPLEWTLQQPQLLDCSFVLEGLPRASASTTRGDDSEGSTKPGSTSFFEDLSVETLKYNTEIAIMDLGRRMREHLNVT
jgi:hypothetical protein